MQQPAIAPRLGSTTQGHVLSEQILRDQLLSQVNSIPPLRDHIPRAMPETSSPASPNDPNINDGTGGTSGVMSTSADSDGGGDNGGDGRKGYGKRELSTSKRAAQNRAAQRAFRQRKEGYIKKLEEQVRDYGMLNENFKAVQAENYQLRDYIINLQSRLLESQGEFPPPPSNVGGLHPGKHGPPAQAGQVTSRNPSSDMTAINQLRAASEQVAYEAAISERIEASKNNNNNTKTFLAEQPSYSASAESARSTKRPRVGHHEMSTAQEALQGPSRNDDPLRAGGREEIVASR